MLQRVNRKLWPADLSRKCIALWQPTAEGENQPSCRQSSLYPEGLFLTCSERDCCNSASRLSSFLTLAVHFATNFNLFLDDNLITRNVFIDNFLQVRSEGMGAPRRQLSARTFREVEVSQIWRPPLLYAAGEQAPCTAHYIWHPFLCLHLPPRRVVERCRVGSTQSCSLEAWIPAMQIDCFASCAPLFSFVPKNCSTVRPKCTPSSL